MKALRIILLAFLMLIFMGIIAGGIFIRYTSRKSLPDYNENINLTILNEEVAVIRDSMAVPHVTASNEADLYRVVGYLQAQDRLWQMDLLRRLTQGRLSEIFGKDMLETDKLFRALQFTSKSERVLGSCDESLLKILDAYTDGVNAYIDEHPGKLPPEFAILGYKPDKWERVHSANLIGYMAWNLTMAWGTEVRLFKLSQVLDKEHFAELLPDMDMQDVYVIPGNEEPDVNLEYAFLEVGEKLSELGLQVFEGSNNWVVSPGKSASGSAILANDMHLGLNAPGIWYQMQQTVPEKLNVTGVVLPGQPFVICGHNDRVAWGMTNVMLDDMDFYLETLNKQDSLQYLLDGEWMNMRVKKELIATKEGDTVIHYNRFTHRGPVISDYRGVKYKSLSMRWIGNEYSNELRSVYLFNRMADIEDFKNAASTFISISQNIAYADVDGNIGMYISAGVPIREGEGIFIVPGDTSLYDWKGIVSFDELPHSYNPECGFIASSNNRTVDDDYPWYISRWYDLPNRQEAILEGLSSKEKLGIEDMMKIQSNQKSKWAEKLVPWFLEMLDDKKEEMNELEKNAMDVLFNWDYEMDAEGIESTIFEQLYYEFIVHIFKDEMGEDHFGDYIKQDLLAAYYLDKVRRTGESIWFDDVNTPGKVEKAEDIALMSFKAAIKDLEDRMGSDYEKWLWGKVHTLSLKHPLGGIDVLDKAFKLNKGPFPVGGSYHTVSPFSFPHNDLYHAKHGASHRHIYMTGNWDSSMVILPTGISGIPASDHYCDQTEDYINYNYKTDYFSDSGIKKAGKYFMNFLPGGKDPE